MSEEIKGKNEINAELQKFKQHRDLICSCGYEGLCGEYTSILTTPYGIINGLFTIEPIAKVLKKQVFGIFYELNLKSLFNVSDYIALT